MHRVLGLGRGKTVNRSDGQVAVLTREFLSSRDALAALYELVRALDVARVLEPSLDKV